MTNQSHAKTNKTEKPSHFTTVFWARSAALVTISAAIGAIILLDLNSWFDMETLRLHQADLTSWVENQGAKAALVYVTLYMGLVLLLIPGPFFATLIGGFLFGALKGTLLTILGATLGASLVFIVAKTAANRRIEKWIGDRAQTFLYGFRKRELRYMLLLRLLPIFPFSLITISAAILGVRFRNFCLGTSLGMMPAVYIVSLAGTSLSEIIDSGDTLSPSTILHRKPWLLWQDFFAYFSSPR